MSRSLPAHTRISSNSWPDPIVLNRASLIDACDERPTCIYLFKYIADWLCVRCRDACGVSQLRELVGLFLEVVASLIEVIAIGLFSHKQDNNK